MPNFSFLSNPDADEDIYQTLVIAGLIREALFYKLPTHLIFEKTAINGTVDYLNETSARGSEKRSIIFLISEKHTLKIGDSVECKIRFESYILQFEANVSEINGILVTCSFPEKVSVVNRRGELRVSVKIPPTVAILERNSSIEEVLLRIENLSKGGIKIQVFHNINSQIDLGDRITSCVKIGEGYVDLKVEVISTSSAAQVDSRSSMTMVRAKFITDQSDAVGDQTNKRKYKRYEANKIVELISPFESSKAFEVDVVDVSSWGFRCKVRASNKSGVNLLVGTPVITTDGKLRFRVTSCRAGTFSLAFTPRNISELVYWLKFITPAVHAKADPFCDIPQDLVRLSVESGTLFADRDYLKKMSSYSSEFSVDDMKNVNSNENLFRWIEKDDLGSYLGHISLIRTGMRSWYLQDFVGSQSKGNKMSPHFLRKFLGLISEGFSAFEDNQKIFFFMTPNHPYWIHARNAFASTAGAVIKSFFIADNPIFKERLKTEIENGAPFSDVEELSIDLKKDEAALFESLKSVGFSIFEELFGIGKKTELYSVGLNSERRFTILQDKIGGRRYLLIATYPDLKYSLNLGTESTFLVPLDNRPISDAVVVQILAKASYLTKSYGIDCPWVRRVLFDDEKQMVGETSLSQCYVVDPKHIELMGAKS